MAVLRIQQFLRAVRAASHIVSIVHDELIFEMPWDELWLIPDICAIMEMPDIFGIAFPVDVEMGLNWGEKREIPPQAVPRLLEGKLPKLTETDDWKKDWDRMKAKKT
jgi:hypothetical protein